MHQVPPSALSSGGSGTPRDRLHVRDRIRIDREGRFFDWGSGSWQRLQGIVRQVRKIIVDLSQANRGNLRNGGGISWSLGLGA